MSAGSDQIYREIILEHWRSPQNKGLLKDFDVQGHLVNSVCGDAILVQIKLTAGVVTAVGFDGEGCALSQASASVLTEEIKGKTPMEVLELEGTDLLDLLEIKITGARLKCIYLSLDSIKSALSMNPLTVVKSKS